MCTLIKVKTLCNINVFAGETWRMSAIYSVVLDQDNNGNAIVFEASIDNPTKNIKWTSVCDDDG